MLAEEAGRIRVGIELGNVDGFQFKTHPNIDKTLYSSSNVLGLKDADKPFPDSPVGILRWRMQVCYKSSYSVVPTS